LTLAPFFAALFLAVSIAAGALAMWLLSRVDRLSPGRKLGRRGLLVLSVIAAAGVTLSGPEWFYGGGPVLSVFIVMALSIGTTGVHHYQRSGQLVCQLELAMIWWLWLGCRILMLRFSLGMVISVAILWLIFAFFAWMALFPGRRHPQ